MLIRLLPPVAVALAAVCVLPFLALLCLQKSLAEIEADATAPLTRPALRRAVGDLWRPALCVSILGFSWKLIAGIEPGTFLRARGRVAEVRGVPTIFNPAYEIVPTA